MSDHEHGHKEHEHGHKEHDHAHGADCCHDDHGHGHGHAEHSEPEVVYVEVEIAPEHIAKFLEVMKEDVKGSRAEPEPTAAPEAKGRQKAARKGQENAREETSEYNANTVRTHPKKIK